MAELTLHHIHHEARDVDAATQFYVDNFGAEIMQRYEEGGVQWARIAIAGAVLNITDRAHTDVARGLYRGLDHFAIHTDDFEATIATLRANEVDFFVEPMSPKPGVQVAFVCGPDNLKVEVLSVTA